MALTCKVTRLEPRNLSKGMLLITYERVSLLQRASCRKKARSMALTPASLGETTRSGLPFGI